MCSVRWLYETHSYDQRPAFSTAIYFALLGLSSQKESWSTGLGTDGC